MRKSLAKLFFALSSIVAGFMMQTHNAAAGEVVGWMDIRPDGDRIEITGRAYAQQQTDIDYTLKIERQGASGRTATKQSGRAAVQPGEIARLSTTSVNVGVNDGLSLLLTISRAGQVISSSAVHVGQP